MSFKSKIFSGKGTSLSAYNQRNDSGNSALELILFLPLAALLLFFGSDVALKFLAKNSLNSALEVSSSQGLSQAKHDELYQISLNGESLVNTDKLRELANSNLLATRESVLSTLASFPKRDSYPDPLIEVGPFVATRTSGGAIQINFVSPSNLSSGELRSLESQLASFPWNDFDANTGLPGLAFLVEAEIPGLGFSFRSERERIVKFSLAR